MNIAWNSVESACILSLSDTSDTIGILFGYFVCISFRYYILCPPYVGERNLLLCVNKRIYIYTLKGLE